MTQRQPQLAWVALLGMMGAGKSTVGHELAAQLQCPFVDLDRDIEAFAGREIPAIFAEQGEGAFRELEHQRLSHWLDARPSGVLATGGGVILDPRNWSAMHDKARTVYLQVPAPQLCARLEQPSALAQRPLLAASAEPLLARLQRLIAQRQSGYEQAEFWVDASHSPAQVAAAIIQCLR